MAIVWSKMSPYDTSGIDNDDDREEEREERIMRLLNERIAIRQRNQKSQADLAAAKAERVVLEAKLAAAKAENVAAKAEKAAAEAKRFALLVQRVIDEHAHRCSADV